MTEDRKLERNPLEEPAPESVLERVKVFARDLAWGVVSEFWNPDFTVADKGTKTERWLFTNAMTNDPSDRSREYLSEKWTGRPPSLELMSILGYVNFHTPNARTTQCILLASAFDLLDQPIRSPHVFVSYRRAVSSALTLAIEARLKHKDSLVGIFIDKSLTVGEPWHGELQAKIRQCEYFVCLLGEVNSSPNNNGEIMAISSLESPFVLQEIAWAIENNKKIIAIRHPNYQLPQKDKYQTDADLQTELDRRQIDFWSIINRLSDTQAIQVDSESAKHYESAINELINALGYSTI